MRTEKRERKSLPLNTRSKRWRGMWLDDGPPPPAGDRQKSRRRGPRRCTATRNDGSPCRRWASRHGDPPLCAAHRGLNHPLAKPADAERCTARTKAGRRCPYWATRFTRRAAHDGPALCWRHGGFPRREPAPEVRRCTATTKAGARCRNIAMRVTRGKEYDGPALCNIHAGVFGPAVPPPERRCSAKTRGGRRCRGWVMESREGHEGADLCPIHARVAGAPPDNTRAWKHGAASHRLFPEDLAVIAETRRLLKAGRLSLDWELSVTRWMLLELLPGTEPGADLPLSTKLRSTGLVFRGTRTVAQILRTRKDLEIRRQEAEGWEAWADQALRELEQEEALQGLEQEA